MRRTWTPRTLARGLAFGTGLGLLSGMIGMVMSLALSRWSFREVPITTYVLVFPVLGCLAGYAAWRHGRVVGVGGTQELGSADAEPNRAHEAEELRRARRRRYLALGFGTGCAFGVIATAADFAWRGWLVLGGPALMNMMLFPYLCVLFAFNLSRAPGERLSLRGVRLSIGTSMMLIAYLAVLLCALVEGQRIGGAAQLYHAQRLSATTQGALFRQMAQKYAVDAPMRLKNTEQLRAGTIPDGILAEQKTFLKSLENAKPEYRTYRYGLIADGEELQGKMAQTNAVTLGKLADHFEGLAAKYTQAERKPWKPVAPDPPMP